MSVPHTHCIDCKESKPCIIVVAFLPVELEDALAPQDTYIERYAEVLRLPICRECLFGFGGTTLGSYIANNAH